jgi:hypothetical protein
MLLASAWAVALHGSACLVYKPSKVLNMIIVSESSAKVAQPVRTDRYTLPRRRSSATLNDTSSHADIRRISVHTEEVKARIHPGLPMSSFHSWGWVAMNVRISCTQR